MNCPSILRFGFVLGIVYPGLSGYNCAQASIQMLFNSWKACLFGEVLKSPTRRAAEFFRFEDKSWICFMLWSLSFGSLRWSKCVLLIVRSNPLFSYTLAVITPLCSPSLSFLRCLFVWSKMGKLDKMALPYPPPWKSKFFPKTKVITV